MSTLIRFLLSVFALAHAVVAAPGFLYTRQDNGTASPCAEVRDLVGIVSPNSPTYPTVPAKLAYACLNAIPLNVTAAAELIDSLGPYIEWQSTLAYLKNPPEEYLANVQEAVDIYSRLAGIKAKIAAGGFSSEYEFGFELYTVILSAHDGHFTYVPDSVGRIFSWGRPLALVSVSEDGVKLPAIFAYTDVVGSQFNNISYAPSAIVQINGEDATAYLQEFSQFGSLQDRDALYNNLFYSPAQISLGSSGTGTGVFTGSGRGRFVYPGLATTLTFANGTTRTIENFARVLVPFTNIESGEDIAERYFYFGQQPAAASRSNLIEALKLPLFNVAEKKRQTEGAPPGYPRPVLLATANVIGGFFLEGEGYEDVAVLTVPSFVSIQTLEVEFQNLGDEFLRKAKEAGKTKLIIDLSANGGGTILQGYDLFTKLFPSIDPFGGNTFRAHEAIDRAGEIVSEFAAGRPRTLNEPNSTVISLVASYFNAGTDLNVDGRKFETWRGKYGPHEFQGDNFTSLHRWDLNDPLIRLQSGGIDITGYGNRPDLFPSPPFEAENIVILTDGYCASTCTIFAEFMRQQAGVTTIVMGGRPQIGPMQAVGGVKGTNVFPWGYIQGIVQTVVLEGGDPNGVFASYYNDVPFARAAISPSSNSRNGLRQGDATQTPLQFIYEPADCRIWYTPEMTVDVSEVWKAAVDSQWNGRSRCVVAEGPVDPVDPVDPVEPSEPYEPVTPYVKRTEKTTQLRPRSNLLNSFGSISLARLVESLDVFTDVNELEVHGDGFMMP